MSRKQEILDAAAELFLARGFAGVGVDEIGERVGISGPAIYHHFKGKDEILATLFNNAMDLVVGDPEADLDELIRHHANFVLSNRELLAVYAHEHRSLADPWRREFAARTRAHAEHWERAIGNAHPGASADDIAFAAQAAIGLLNSVVLWPAGLLDEAGAVDRLHKMARYGIDGLAMTP